MKFNLNSIIRYIEKSNIWVKLILSLIIFLVISHVYSSVIKSTSIEGFTQKEKFINKENDEIYDDFYCSIYDKLVYDPTKNNFEVGELIRTTNMKPNTSIILDIGSGTGHHVKTFQDNGYDVHGLDKSKSMVDKSKSVYNKSNFKVGDATNSMIYPANTFTHINCLYFTVYYIEDKNAFFQNCYKWLKPGGYLNIHLVNRDKFNPIINAADPLVIVSPQKYSKKRITNSLVKFNNFQYKADFKYKPEKDLAIFEETFKDDKSGNVRKNNHKFYMETQKDILSRAKDAGFILKGKLDMVYCKYEYQYIYILYKPE